MLQNSDLFIVERAGVRYKMTADQLADFIGAVRDHTVADIAARDAYASATTGDRIFVTDATADPTVNAGWAIYRVQSVGPLVFEKIEEQEGLDLVIVGAALGYTASPTGGTVTNTAGLDASLPVVDGTNAGLATPAMLADSHKEANAGGTAATNPVVVDAATQAITFNITQLASLP